MRPVRLSIVGFGVAGQWLAAALHRQRAWIEQEYGFSATLVGVANARHGFVYREAGLDVPTLLEHAAARRPLYEHPGITRWATAVEGLRAMPLAGSGAVNVMAEATLINLRDAEPGVGHIRTALSRGMHVVTSNKGPAALAGTDLLALARARGVQFRMESAVMSGTPVLSTIREGLAGAQVRAIRGLLNGTVNYVLTAMAEGQEYAEALADAQAAGYAEPDPRQDVEGDDAVAKTLILAAIAFGRGVPPDRVRRRGITGLTREDAVRARERGYRLKHLATLQLVPDPSDDARGGERLDMRVEPTLLPLNDPLSRVDGVLNAVAIQTAAGSQVTVIGPGAGREQAGQGMLADVIAIARTLH